MSKKKGVREQSNVEKQVVTMFPLDSGATKCNRVGFTESKIMDVL